MRKNRNLLSIIFLSNSKIGIITKLQGITEIDEIKVNLNNKIEETVSEKKNRTKSINIFKAQKQDETKKTL